jgi:hypothetical protein
LLLIKFEEISIELGDDEPPNLNEILNKMVQLDSHPIDMDPSFFCFFKVLKMMTTIKTISA